MLTVNITYKFITLSSSCVFCNLPGTTVQWITNAKLFVKTVQVTSDSPSWVEGLVHQTMQPGPLMHGMAHVRAKDYDPHTVDYIGRIHKWCTIPLALYLY